MTIKLLAKPIVRNKFWIVERDGEKVATIQSTVDGVVYVDDTNREKFPSIKVLSSKHNIKFTEKLSKPKKEKKAEFEIMGYPTSHEPHNMLYDVKNKLHIYTKNKKSKSYFCAGYYLFKFADGWVKSFCPKLITISRYPFRGPFKSTLELQAHRKEDHGK